MIGFIGAGNMGFAIMSSMVKNGMKHNIIFTDSDVDRRDYVTQQLNIKFKHTNKELVEGLKYIVLAVKPQFVNEVIKEIKESVNEDTVIVSISPMSIEQLKYLFGFDIKIVRVMPNTPALVSEAMSVICFSDNEFSDEEKNIVISIFDTIGKYEIMDEKYMNAVTAVSGSSPAYVFMFIEAMADAAVRYGINRKTAYKLVAQSMLGASKLVLGTNEHPAVLKDNVCSPGGTTIEAIASLEKNGFRNAIIEAVDICYKKSKSLSSSKD